MDDYVDPTELARDLIAKGEAGEAIRRLNGLLAKGRGGVLTWVALGRAQLASGDVEAGLASMREANFLSPNLAVTAIALGEALLTAGALPAAVAEFQRALRLDPDSSEAQWQLARAWLEGGEAEKAREHLQAVREFAARSSDDIAALERAIDAVATESRSPAGYVRHLFDQFSADYDARMIGTLGYRVPQILIELWSMLGPPRRGLAVLDLGCGTGLGGAVFKPVAKRLVGVDLSPKMIDKARERGIYDELVVADIVAFLGEARERFDLCLAADVLVYLGDLADVFTGVGKALNKDGLFLCTVEAAEDGFALGAKRRWQHSEAYLKDTAAQAGLTVRGFMTCIPRYDAGVPIAGFAVALAPN